MRDWWTQDTRSKNITLFIIGATFFLDDLLLTSIVPVLPEILYNFKHPNNTLRQNQTSNETISKNQTSAIQAELGTESVAIGWLLSMKPIVHIIFAPFIGSWTHKIGFTIPIFLGTIVLFVTTMVFVFAVSYWTLFAARACQGFGAALINVSGLAMVAASYNDNNERQKAFSFTISCVVLGIIVGPIYGAFSYEFFGGSVPFLILAVPILVIICLQFAIFKPKVVRSEDKSTSIFTLVKDPYILLTAATITIANLGYGILETALPLRMLQTMHASHWQLGIVFFPATLGYIISQNIFGCLKIPVHKRYMLAVVGLILTALSLSTLTFATTMLDLILPNASYGFAVALVDCAMIPQFSFLVDLRHTSVYGNVYAIGDLSICLSFALGPVLGGTLLNLLGYNWVLYIAAIICLSFSPLVFYLRDPPAKNEQLALKSSKRIK